MSSVPAVRGAQRALARSLISLLLVATVAPRVFGAANCAATSVGFPPLTDLGAGTYQGFEGGLYPGGWNTPPAVHAAAALARAQAITPRDAAGTLNSNGKYVLLAIGPSVATQEFSVFRSLANADPAKDTRLVLVDGAQEGEVASIIIDPAANFWSVVASRLAAAGVTPAQVSVVWMKEGNLADGIDLAAYRHDLQAHLEAIARLLYDKFPNLQIIYQSSRTYGGYELGTLNPEPYAYESGLAVKWSIATQINGAAALNYDAARGPVEAPLLLWGPYLWADGLTPRSDGLTWACSDFEEDGIHPSASGETKVANLLLSFFKTDVTAREWFLAPPTIPPTVALTAPGNNATFTAPASLALTANASDSDGTVARVEFFTGATKLGEDATSPYAFTWANPGAGTHALTARAIDNTGAATTSAVVTVVIAGATNPPPTVAITAPANNTTYASPATVTFTATASDSNGTITRVQFYNGSSLMRTDTTAPYSYSVSGVPAGTYTVTARATDNAGAVTISAGVTIIVGGTANTAPSVSLTAPANNATFIAPASLTLTASAADSNGTVTRVEFYSGATLLGQDTTSPYAFAWSSVAAGTYTLTARATDNAGATTTSPARTIIVNVAAPNTPPTVALTAPANNTTFTAPASVALTATASDTGGAVAKVEFFAGATLLGADTTAPYAFTWTNVPAGSYAFTVRATDNAGAVTTSAASAVVVNNVVAVGGVNLWLEAECGIVGTRWTEPVDANASSGSYVQVANGYNSSLRAPTTTSGWLTYIFNVDESGSYRIWGRVIAPTQNDNAFWVRVDGGAWVAWNNIATSSAWRWAVVHNANSGNQAVAYTLEPGDHVLDIAYREDGTRLDKLYITNTATTPTGAGGSAENCN